MIKKTLYLLVLLTTSFSSFATTQHDVSIQSIGIGLNPNPNMTGNFKVTEKLDADCPYGVIHFNATSNIGKAMFSTILMAKASNKKLSRIDYFLSPNNAMCTLSYAEVAE